MTTSFFTAITGLDSMSLAINVVGHNLANINTTAYKGSRTQFSELLGGFFSNSTTGNPVQIGIGVHNPSVSPTFTQGSIGFTGKSTDAAISGKGFFVVDTDAGQGYTRAGNFHFSAEGDLINSDGFKVLGFPALNGVIDTSGALAPIRILLGGTLQPKATTNMSVSANLDSQAAVNDTFSASVQVFDTLGASHTVTMTFTKTAALAWDYDATIPAVDTGGLPTDAAVSIGTGSFAFDGTGALTSPTANETLSIAGLINGAADFDVSFDIFDTNGVPRFTGNSSSSSVSNTSQNGYASSVLRDITFQTDGVIAGIFDSGQVQPLAQLAMSTFANVEGLVKFRGSTFVTGIASGQPAVGVAGVGGRGNITGNSLEQSNVDIAEEFTHLILAQRGFQANSRVITTSDELMQEAIALKR